jgi:predicted Zn-dependent protease
VSERHVIKNIVQTSGLFLMVQTLFGDITGLLAVLSEKGAYLLSMNFSRENELEADNVGFEHLVEAGVDPRGMSSFFEHIIENRNELEKKAEENLSFLNSHPQTQERIDNINFKYDKLDHDKKMKIVRMKFDIIKFKDKLRTLETFKKDIDEVKTK